MEKYKTQPQDTLGLNTYNGVSNEEFIQFSGDRNAPFCALLAGITNPDENYFINRKSFSGFVIEYVVSGEGFVEVDGVRESVSAGDVYVLSPGKSHCYGANKQNPYKKIWLNFISQMFVDIASHLSINDKFVYRGCNSASALFTQILEIAQSSQTQDIDVHSELSKVVYSLFLALSSVKNDPTPGNAFTKRVYQVVSSAIYGKLTIKDLAQKLCVSQAHLIKQFKLVFGVTPYKFLLDKKIDTAQNLLRHTDMNVFEIASALGFDNEHYFSDLFKQKTGLSPLKFRKSND